MPTLQQHLNALHVISEKAPKMSKEQKGKSRLKKKTTFVDVCSFRQH